MMSDPHSRDLGRRALRCSSARIAGLLAVAWLLAFPSAAHASLLSPEAEDKMANFIAIFALCIVPVTLIVLFWMVHVLPEKIAHKRHHPQLEAIKTLCLLSLVFGGLLWPIAWLWAYTKPVGYKLAYGTDKSPEYFKEHGLPSRKAPSPTYGSAWPRSKSTVCQTVSSTPFAKTWQRSSRGWRRATLGARRARWKSSCSGSTPSSSG